MLVILGAWRAISGAAGGAWHAVAASRHLQYALAGITGVLLVLFGIRRAVKKAKAAGAAEREETIFDQIERDTKNAIEKIETAERDISQAIGPAPVYQDAGDGRGLVSDDLNSRELERLRSRAETDNRNRRNPREDPRG